MKRIRITESELIDLIKKSLEEQVSPVDEEILSSFADMGFEKKNCSNYKPESEALQFEFCHKSKPNLVILFNDGGLELLNIGGNKERKIIRTWDKFNSDDLIDLEQTIKPIFSQNFVDEQFLGSMEYDDAEPIVVLRLNHKERTSKKMFFYEYEIQDNILYLINEDTEVVIVYDKDFRDADTKNIVYRPLNKIADSIFKELV